MEVVVYFFDTLISHYNEQRPLAPTFEAQQYSHFCFLQISLFSAYYISIWNFLHLFIYFFVACFRSLLF